MPLFDERRTDIIRSMTWPCQNTNELREFFGMKKKGLGSPAYELGIHIKKYREQKNWSQDDLASKIGTDQKRISKIETGNVNIGWDTFYQIAQALEVSMDELVEGDRYQKKNTREIDGYPNLKESQKKIVKDLVHEFLEAGGNECRKS